MTLSELGIEVKAGESYTTTCPNCRDSRKAEHRKAQCLSVKVMPDYAIFNCHHCSFSGSTIDHDKYAEVRANSRMPQQKKKLYSKEVRDFLGSKHISEDVAMEDGIYEVAGYNGTMEVAFPYFYKNQLVNVMFRRLKYDETKQSKVYQIPKRHGTLTCFWGLHKLDLEKSQEVIITEGQTDRLTWLQCGYTNVLSIPMGASKSLNNIEKKLEFATDPYIVQLFRGVRRFYIAMDGDEAGQVFKEHLIEKLGKTRCFVVSYPPGYKDSNEVYAGDTKKGLEPQGKTGIENLFKEAVPYPVRGIITIWDVKREIDHIASVGYDKGYVINNSRIDKLMALRKDLTVVFTGISNHGKSTFLRWYLTEQCKVNPFMRWALHTPEAKPSREFPKIVECYAGKSLFEYSSNKMNRAEQDAAERWVSSHFTIINPDKKMFELFDPKYRIKGLKNILSYVRHMRNTTGLFGYVLDPWNKLEHERPAGMNETDFISRQLDIVGEFNELHDMCGVIVAHPTKIETVRGGNYRQPSLYDISGSANWFNKPDMGVVVYRKDLKKSNRKNDDGDDIWEEDEEAPTEIIVGKMRYEELGKKGRTQMYLNKRNGNQFVADRPPIFTSEGGKQEAAVADEDLFVTAPF